MRVNIAHNWPILFFTALFILLFYISGLSSSVNQQLYDYFLRFKMDAAPDDVVIVAIDEKSLNALGKWPWPRDAHAQLLQQLKQLNPRLIAFDVLFTEPSSDAEADQKLIHMIKDMGNVILPIYIGKETAGFEHAPIFKRQPFNELSTAAATLGHVQFNPDADGIGRSIFLYEGVIAADHSSLLWPHLALATSVLEKKQSLSIPADSTEFDHYINIARKDRRYIPFIGPPGSFLSVSFIDVLLGRVTTNALENKIVFVGATAAGLGDSITTPITGDDEPMSGVEGHANIFQAIRSNNLIHWLPELNLFWLSLLLCCWIALLGIRFSARSLFFVCFFIASALLFLMLCLLRYFNIWLPAANSILGLMTIYPLWSLYRLNQTGRFLSEEIVRVKHAPVLFPGAVDSEQLGFFQADVNSLLSAGILRAWWIDDTTGSRLLTSGKMPRQYVQNEISEGELLLDNKLYRWGVVWKETKHKDSLERYLQQLKPRKDIQPETSEEIVSASIEYLQQANRHIRSMYNMSLETLQGIQGSVLVLEKSGRIIFANDKAKRLFSLREITLEKYHIYRCFESMQALDIEKTLYEVLFLEKSVYKEFETPGEEYFLLQANSVDLSLKRHVILLTITDITELKKLQKSRAEALRFLSHDLRAPMVSILSLLELAEDQQGQVDPEIFATCAELARKNLSFANSYLQIVRAEEASMKTDLLDVVGVFETAIAGVFTMAQQHNIQLNIDWPEEVVWVDANIDLLSRALQNLLDNAIKYSRDAGLVSLSIRVEEERVGFSFVDQGIGIPEDEIEDLLSSFKRASNAQASNIDGTGLGLRFVDLVSQRHGGSVEIKSQLNQGSTFILWLPKVQDYVQ